MKRSTIKGALRLMWEDVIEIGIIVSMMVIAYFVNRRLEEANE